MTQPIVITGCQRSGTTLLNLILDSHPQICGVEEIRFRRRFTLEHFKAELAAASGFSHVSFKLPMQSHQVGQIVRSCDGFVPVVWLLRDPRAVVASMIRLHVPVSRFVSVSWAASFIHKEIINALQVLPEDRLDRIEGLIHRFRLIENVPSILRPAEDIYFSAALCWRLKQLTLDWHAACGLRYQLVRYEDLVREPESVLRDLLRAVGIAWDAAVLDHPRHSRVSAIGGTRRDRPISAERLEQWREELDDAAKQTISTVCGDTAAEYGYQV
jgi:hypothetical protein